MTSSFPEPEVGEIPVWRHSGHCVLPPQIISEKLAKKITYVYYLLWCLLTGFWLSRPGTWEYFVSVRFAIEIIVIAALAYFGPKLIDVISTFLRNGKDPETTAIPLWMSKDRLAYSSGDKLIDQTLNVGDILAIAPDYAMGSPALALSLKDRTIMLISSELNNLTQHLYTLRPDLEPSS